MSQQLTEEMIRTSIRKYAREQFLLESQEVLLEQNYALRMMPSDWKKIFVEPWANFLKGVKIEAKKIAAGVVLSVRMLLTFNQKKAAEMKARYKDRMRAFQKESDEVFQALGGDKALNDANFLLFLANPGVFVASRLVKAAASGAKGTAKFAKETGVGDKSIATLAGEESEEAALARRREDRGPIAKALGALEQVFLFAGYAPTDGVLLEAIDPTVEQDISNDVMAGPLGAGIRASRKALATTMKELIELIESVGAQNAFLAGIGSPEMLENLVHMRGAIDGLSQANPEAAEELNKILDSIQAEARDLSADEKFRTQLKKKHAEEDEELSPEFILQQALTAVTGEVFDTQYSEFMKLIQQNQELLLTTFTDIFPKEALTDDVTSALDNVVPGFKKSVRIAERILGVELRS